MTSFQNDRGNICSFKAETSTYITSTVNSGLLLSFPCHFLQTRKDVEVELNDYKACVNLHKEPFYRTFFFLLRAQSSTSVFIHAKIQIISAHATFHSLDLTYVIIQDRIINPTYIQGCVSIMYICIYSIGLYNIPYEG